MKASDQILFFLKTQGAQSTHSVAAHMALTSMGARKHLQALQENGLLEFDERIEGPGRPTRYWQLSAAGHQRFPDRHSDLTLQLITHVKTLFGEAGLHQLIDARESQAKLSYAARMQSAPDLAARLQALVAIRREEGYMAEVHQEPDGSWLLVENHCPICAAAAQCQQFCHSELALFQQLLGPEVSVQRDEHILAGARRCAYRISNHVSAAASAQHAQKTAI